MLSREQERVKTDRIMTLFAANTRTIKSENEQHQ